MGTSKKKSKDFKLISEKTKARIRGLIEKKLTTQTVALFAQEYEDYQPNIRIEILEYIFFLLEKEEQELNDNFIDNNNIRNKIIYDRKKREYTEKKENIKRIQEMLDVNLPAKKLDPTSDQRTKIIKIEEPQKKYNFTEVVKKQNQESGEKDSKKIKNSNQKSIEKRIFEAQKREELEEKKRAEEIRIAQEKQFKIQREEFEKKRAEEIFMQEQEIEKAKKIEIANILKEQKEKEIKIQKINRDYEKEQKEKEKLWYKLYGKTRQESLREWTRFKNSLEYKPLTEDDKRHILRLETNEKDFKIINNSYLIEELIDPKNRYFLFWNNIKKKQNVISIYSLIKEKPANLLKKIVKKREKYEKRLKKSGTTSFRIEPTINKQTIKSKKNQKTDKNVKLTENE